MLPLLVTDASDYLAADSVVDHGHAEVNRQAALLRTGRPDDVDFARAAFEFVRDEIQHSWDAQDSRVTLSASDTLREGVGLCFSKSHLLVGLLRAEGVPAGFCYQRLTDDGEHFDVHGLIAVHLEGAWHRQDPRGNKPGVDAQFSLTGERLAWPVRPRLGEYDYIDVLREPHPTVVNALRSADDMLALCAEGLPDSLSDATPHSQSAAAATAAEAAGVAVQTGDTTLRELTDLAAKAQGRDRIAHAAPTVAAPPQCSPADSSAEMRTTR